LQFSTFGRNIETGSTVKHKFYFFEEISKAFGVKAFKSRRMAAPAPATTPDSVFQVYQPGNRFRLPKGDMMLSTRKVFLKSAGVALGILLLFSLAINAQAATLYVTEYGNGNGDGSSWDHAMNKVAFRSALQTCAENTDFWVKAGTYTPTANQSLREATFAIRPGVFLYGGFAGTETTLNQRNPAVNVTILSGEINYDGSHAGNSYHVVTGASGVSNARLDGFTVTGGYANDGSALAPTSHGGGMYNINCANLLVNNCTFSGNYGTSGGGMYNSNSNTTVTYCTFSGNESWYEGGGMFSDQCDTLTVTGCTFWGNRANQGGGMYCNTCNSTITNCTFSENSAAAHDPDIGAVWGGGLSIVNDTSHVTNCTFWNNSATDSGKAILTNRATVTLTSCLLWDPLDNKSEIQNVFTGETHFSYCLVRGWESGTGNINPTDPGLGPLADNGGPTKTHALLPGSPALDSGDPDSTLAIDQRGVIRPQAGRCDMGAFELATFTISGNAGIAGAVLSYTDGTAKNATADGSGNYSFFVSTNWSGTVTPAFAGYDFSPTSRSYTSVLASQINQDYITAPIIPNIWGTIKSGSTPLAGVVLNGLPGTPTTDTHGQYTTTVTYGWSGTVTPALAGYTFTPAERVYASVVTGTASNYTASAVNYTISGTVTDGATPIQGVTITFNHNGHTETTLANGTYSYAVPYQTTTTLTPSHPGYGGWTPASRTINTISANQPNQNFSATINSYTISGTVTDGSTPIQGVTITFNHNGHTETTLANGTYSYAVPYQTTTTLTPSHPGYGGWTPASRTINTISSNQPNQNFSATINSYTITATAGAGGAITPSGPVDVAYAGSQDFVITPDLHARISDVLVDGASVGAVTSYSFANVADNHTISASFSIIRYTVTAHVEGEHGTANPALQRVNSGETALIRLVPKTGYKLCYLSDNGSIITPTSEYRIDDVRSDHLVIACFENGLPLVEITQPKEDALVTGLVEVKAQIEDEGKIQGAELYVDGTLRQTSAVREIANSDLGSTIAKTAKTWQLTTAEMSLEFGPGPLLISSDNVLSRLDESGTLLPVLSPGRKVSHVQRLKKTDALLFVFADPCPDSVGVRSRIHLLNRANSTLQALVPERFAPPLLLANNLVFQEDEQEGIWFVMSIQNGVQAELWRWSKQNGLELINTVPFIPLSWQLQSDAKVMFQERTLNDARRWLLSGNELSRVDDHAAHLVGNSQIAGSDASAAELLENGFSARFGNRSFGLSGNSVRVRDIQLGTVVEVSTGPWEPYHVSVAGEESFLILGRDPQSKTYGLLRLAWSEAGAGIYDLTEFASRPACAAELEAGNQNGTAGSERGRSIGRADSGEWTFIWDSGLDRAGMHALKVVATDEAGATGMDEVQVNLATVKLTLSALRKTVRSWSFVRHYGQIELAVGRENTPSLRFRLLRRTGSGSYAQLQEFGESELQNGGWSFQDKYLEKDLRYTYVVEALDPSGRVLGRSGELTI
jgi:hypothetical protein